MQVTGYRTMFSTNIPSVALSFAASLVDQANECLHNGEYEEAIRRITDAADALIQARDVLSGAGGQITIP